MLRITVLSWLFAMLGMPVDPMRVAAQQPCNPVIDGTYCATQIGKPAQPGTAARSLPAIEGIAGDLFIEQNNSVTLGAITFQGDRSRCIGLLRRSNCS
jgi:hypothetical protein